MRDWLSVGPLLVLGLSSFLFQVDAAVRSSLIVRNRRPESCKEQFPRRYEDLASVVLVGRVMELGANQQKALVEISRLLRGPPNLTSGSSIVVDGLSDASIANQNCPNNSPTTGVFPMNLNNLERVSALVNQEVYKKRPQIEDILCEVHYCPYGRCKVDERNQTGCHCPDFCEPSLVSPVCGSDNSTYQNECQLIMEGCRQKRPLFVTKEKSC